MCSTALEIFCLRRLSIRTWSFMTITARAIWWHAWRVILTRCAIWSRGWCAWLSRVFRWCLRRRCIFSIWIGGWRFPCLRSHRLFLSSSCVSATAWHRCTRCLGKSCRWWTLRRRKILRGTAWSRLLPGRSTRKKNSMSATVSSRKQIRRQRLSGCIFIRMSKLLQTFSRLSCS